MSDRATRAAFAFALFVAAFAVRAAPTDSFPGAAAAYLVTVDGVPAFAAHPERPLPPASLAKLMTALLVAEAAVGDAIVTIGPGAAAETGTRLGLRAGERVRASDLLAAMLVASANDACRALADWLAGSEREFVARMNARAAALGLGDTVFRNACGHDAPGMHSSARDLSALADRVLAQPQLAGLAALEQRTLRTLGGRTFRVRTTNAFVGRIPGVTGLKTGYTARAGTCLVLTAEREGVRVIVVLLGARERWWDAAAMLEHGFDFANARPPR